MPWQHKKSHRDEDRLVYCHKSSLYPSCWQDGKLHKKNLMPDGMVKSVRGWSGVLWHELSIRLGQAQNSPNWYLTLPGCDRIRKRSSFKSLFPNEDLQTRYLHYKVLQTDLFLGEWRLSRFGKQIFICIYKYKGYLFWNLERSSHLLYLKNQLSKSQAIISCERI